MCDMPAGSRNVTRFWGVIALGAALGLTGTAEASPRSAAASKWQEAHQAADDVRITVGADGSALVERQVRVRVVAGVFKGFDLPAIEKNAVPTPDVEVTASDGARTPARLERAADPKKTEGASPAPELDTLRVVVDDDKALRRGSYTFKLSYRVDVTDAAHLDKDGALWKLTWASAPSPEGRDVARVTFDLPTAPTPPRVAPIDPPPGAPPGASTDDPTMMSNVKRLPERDEIELVRPHVARGEAVRWSVRVDPKALPRLAAEAPKAAPPSPVATTTAGPVPRLARWLTALGVLLGAAIVGLFVHHKDRDVERAARARGAEPAPLVPARFALGRRAIAAGLLAGVGAGLVALAGIGAAGVLVAVAALLGVHRPPRLAARAAGGGAAGVPLRAEDAFDGSAPEPSWLDASTRRGKGALAAMVVVAAAGAIGLSFVSPRGASLVVLFAAALAPVFVTGLRSQLGPLAGRGSSALAGVHRELASRGLLVRALGLVRRGARDAAEVRVWVSPEVSILGFTGVEVAAVEVPSLSGRAERFELVARVLDGSVAADRIAALVPGAVAEPGRKPEERVFALAPSRPDAASAAELAASIADVVRERRVEGGAPLAKGATERRRPRSEPKRAARRAEPAPARGAHSGVDLAPAFGG